MYSISYLLPINVFNNLNASVRYCASANARARFPTCKKMPIDFFSFLQGVQPYATLCLGYALGAVATTILHLSSGKALINPTKRQKPINRMTNSIGLKWGMCILGAVVALVPVLLFIKPGTFEAALTAAFITIPYVHTGAITTMVQEKFAPLKG